MVTSYVLIIMAFNTRGYVQPPSIATEVFATEETCVSAGRLFEEAANKKMGDVADAVGIAWSCSKR